MAIDLKLRNGKWMSEYFKVFRKKFAPILPSIASFLLPIIIAILLTACGSAGVGGNTDTGTANNNESNNIGTNGGTVTSSDGKAKIVIPSAAIAQDTPVTVAAVSNQPHGNIGTAYEFGPDGITFNKPVTISITYDDGSLPSGISESDIKLGMVTNNQWQEITNSNVDTALNVVSGTTTHLSTYGLVAVSSYSMPAAPTGVVASAGDGNASISWNTVSGATSFNIYWSTTSGVSKTSYTGKIAGVTSPYPHMGLINGTTYYYVVTAVNGYGESSESSQVSAVPKSSVFFDTAAPSNTTASNFINSGAATTNSTNVTLIISATDNEGVAGYYVTETAIIPAAGTAGWIAVTPVTSYSTSVSFTLSSGDGPKTLYVRFKDAAGNVSTSKSGTITLDTAAPSNPTTISGYSNASKTSALTSGNWYNYTIPYFEWGGASDDSSGVAGYYVYFGTDAIADPAASGTYQTSANYTALATITPGSTYYLSIKAKDNAGNIASGIYTAFSYQYDSSVPTNTTGSNFIDSGASTTNTITVALTLSATDDEGVTGYCANESSAAPSGNDICWTSITSTTSYSAGVTFTLSNGEGVKTVYVWFRDAAGNISSVANDSITLGSPPSAPTGVTATVSDGQVTLSWNTVSDATSYNIYWSTTSGVTKSTGTKISNVINPYTHTGRANGTTYYYVVTVVNDYGESVESSQVLVIPQAPISLPKTGQTTCYDSSGNIIACRGTGQDGDIQAGVAWPSPRFTDNGDGTVTDNLTDLIWTKDGNTPGPLGCSPATPKTWQGALDYVACLNTNSYLGYKAWRLPNVNELRSLMNAGQTSTSAWLNTIGFNIPSSQYSSYWSSNSYDSSSLGAWIVQISDCSTNAVPKSGAWYVWPVLSGQSESNSVSTVQLPKTGQTTSYAVGDDGDLQVGVAWPIPRLKDNGDGTVLDNLTNLVWTKDGNAPGPVGCSPSSRKKWQNALDYVTCLNNNSYLGYTDWRLPNINELRSVVNTGQTSTSAWLNTIGFYGVVGVGYWSSTSYSFSTDHALLIDLWSGSMSAHGKSNLFYVWPVRSGQ